MPKLDTKLPPCSNKAGSALESPVLTLPKWLLNQFDSDCSSKAQCVPSSRLAKGSALFCTKFANSGIFPSRLPNCCTNIGTTISSSNTSNSNVNTITNIAAAPRRTPCRQSFSTSGFKI